MRVLWLTCTPGGATKILNDKRPGRGWIASLGDLIKADNNIDLAVAFFNDPPNDFKFDYDGVTYYPMEDKLGTRIGQIKTRLIRKPWDTNLSGVINAIDDFKPDIIHIFGTESGMGDIVDKTNIPIIIHIQGLINPILFNWLPKGINSNSLLFKSTLKELILRRDLLSEFAVLKRIAIREEHVIKNTKYFFGRTDWDERVVRLLNPVIQYFHCDEVLRPFFYNHSGEWRHMDGETIRLVTTINPQTYKGLDIVLETAQILKNKTQLKFEWNIIGVNKENRIVKVIESSKKKTFKSSFIIFNGVRQGEELISALLNSHLFIHPSHIDNSPNSICEAMLLGMPVIAGYVGGIPSLIEHEFNGLLYNSYDPYDLAGLIIQSANNPTELERIGENAKMTALKRHDRTRIVDTIKRTYKKILSNYKIEF